MIVGGSTAAERVRGGECVEWNRRRVFGWVLFWWRAVSRKLVASLVGSVELGSRVRVCACAVFVVRAGCGAVCGGRGAHTWARAHGRTECVRGVWDAVEEGLW